MGDNVIKDITFGTIGYIFGRREAVRKMRMPVPFRNKIVITVPSWAIPLVAVAIGAATYFNFSHVANVVELLIVAASFMFAYEMHRIVQRLRVRIHEIINNIGNEDLDDRFGAWMDEELPIPEPPAKRLTLNGKSK